MCARSWAWRSLDGRNAGAQTLTGCSSVRGAAECTRSDASRSGQMLTTLCKKPLGVVGRLVLMTVEWSWALASASARPASDAWGLSPRCAAMPASDMRRIPDGPERRGSPSGLRRPAAMPADVWEVALLQDVASPARLRTLLVERALFVAVA